MARAEDIEITGSEPFRVAGARIVRTRTGELFEHSEGVLDTSEIERVHAMRVASRRLRAVLEIFAVCFPATDYKGVLRDVKELADALGERRDPDVHVDALTTFSRALTPAQRPGVKRLIEEQRARQARGNDLLAAALERAHARGLHERLRALADAADPDEPDDPDDPDDATGSADPAEKADAAPPPADAVTVSP